MERFARTNEGDVKKLSGVHLPEQRLRVGPFRVRFTLDETRRLMTVLRVLPRDKAYKVREPKVEFTTEEVLEAGIA